MFFVFKIRSCADTDPAVLEVLVRKKKKRKPSKLEGKDSESECGRSRHHCLVSDLVRKVFNFSSLRMMFTVTL